LKNSGVCFVGICLRLLLVCNYHEGHEEHEGKEKNREKQKEIKDRR
jgi:hypothetical protein